MPGGGAYGFPGGADPGGGANGGCCCCSAALVDVGGCNVGPPPPPVGPPIPGGPLLLSSCSLLSSSPAPVSQQQHTHMQSSVAQQQQRWWCQRESGIAESAESGRCECAHPQCRRQGRTSRRSQVTSWCLGGLRPMNRVGGGRSRWRQGRDWGCLCREKQKAKQSKREKRGRKGWCV